MTTLVAAICAGCGRSAVESRDYYAWASRTVCGDCARRVAALLSARCGVVLCPSGQALLPDWPAALALLGKEARVQC